MAIEAIAIGIFLFVAFAVAGCRALDVLSRKADARQAARTEYTGPTYSYYGNELESGK